MNVISDVHFDYRENIYSNEIIAALFEKDTSQRILIIAGDLGSPLQENYFDFLAKCSAKWKHVLLVAGNHEYYNEFGLSMEKIESIIRSGTEKMPNVIFLQKSSVIIDGIRYLGCTLWSQIDLEKAEILERTVRDFSRIYVKRMRMTAEKMLRLHLDHLSWLEEELKNQEHKTVVITHHPPLRELIHEKYKIYEDLASAFSSDLSRLQHDNISEWVSGHTHTRTEFVLGATKYTTNSIAN